MAIRINVITTAIVLYVVNFIKPLNISACRRVSSSHAIIISQSNQLLDQVPLIASTRMCRQFSPAFYIAADSVCKQFFGRNHTPPTLCFAADTLVR